jgi:peptidoglycan hydrolase CwlO-like protein
MLGAVVILLVAILIGVVVAATRDRRTQVSEEWIQDLDELQSRLEAMASEIALLDAQIAQLDEIETLQTEITHLRHENERLQRAGKELLDELARISELLGRRAT